MVATLTMLPFVVTGVISSLAALDYLGYGLPTSAPVRAYVQRVTQLPATQEWIQAALAEQDFLQFEEPYRQQR